MNTTKEAPQFKPRSFEEIEAWLNDVRRRKREREAQLRQEYAEQQRVKAEAFARFEAFCEANGI